MELRAGQIAGEIASADRRRTNFLILQSIVGNAIMENGLECADTNDFSFVGVWHYHFTEQSI